MNTPRARLLVDSGIPYLRERIEDLFDCRFVHGDDISHALCREAEGLLVRTRTKCGCPLLEETPVEFVATGTIGLDHFDTEWLTEAGIDWQNAPGCNAPGVAQYVWSSLLRLGFRPKERPLTLGVVGKGNVGRIIVEWGRILGAEVIVCDPPRAERGEDDEKYLPLEALLERADAVTFHTPLTREGNHPTYHLLDAEKCRHLKQGAIIVNAARGGVVDEKALLDVKAEKNLTLAIDTWEGEPQINLATLKESAIATPHIAGYSREGKERATLAIITGLERHFGVEIDKEGLALPYTTPIRLTEERILESFDPMPTDAKLRSNPLQFETQRDSYIYRREV